MIVAAGSWREWDVAEERTSLTVGVLDGVHVGHRSLLQRVLDGTGQPTVLTFEPHPIEVLVPDSQPRLLTTLEERVGLLEDEGIERVGVLDLREIRDLRPEQFVAEILVGKLRAANVVAGVDFQFGKNRAGSIALLHEMAHDGGFELDAIELVEDDGIISSSRIRGLIEMGRVADANDLLGRRFSISSVVVDGDKRGNALGFPTANLIPPERKVKPADGVYAAWVDVGESRWMAAVNVGVRPTFGGGGRLIEPYLLDFEGDLYGQTLTVEFEKRIRDELAFDTVDALVTQMHDDVARTRVLLGS